MITTIKEERNASFVLRFNWSLALMLAVLAVLFSFGCRNAAADITKKVEKDNYAYVRGDYSGIDHAAKSVFYVEMYDSENQNIGTGSGFVMFDEGLFVTNRHVIEGTSYLIIMDDDGRQYILDQVVVSDAEHDIAILLFPEAKNQYDSLAYNTAFDQLKRGQAVLAIGSPKGLPGTVSDGIISAFPKFQGEDIRYIQITAPISHGSSGGCLLNENLEVIGVTSAGIEAGENIGFAIPVMLVEQLYSQWNKQDTVTLGSQTSWDTVGYGLHNRISGAVGKPQVQSASSESTGVEKTPAPSVSAEDKQSASSEGAGDVQTQTPAGSTVDLDVTIWYSYPDSLKEYGLYNKFALTINDKTLSWDQTVESAALFCNQNGIQMKHFDDDVNQDAYAEYGQSIRFIGTIDVQHGFYVRKGADTPKLTQIDISIKSTQDLSELVESALDTYEKLRQRFGPPTESWHMYTEAGGIDFQLDDLAKTIEQMSQQSGSYSYLYTKFDDLMFSVVYNGTDSNRWYDVNLSLLG